MTVPLVSTSHRALGGGLPWLLGPSLGTDSTIWDAAVDLLPGDAASVRWDLPGHGTSAPPASRFSISELAEAVIRALDFLGIERVRAAGVSLGGVVSLQLALDFPDRVEAIAMICSLPRIGTHESWQARAEQVLADGTGSLVGATPDRWFTPSFRQASPRTVESMLAALDSVDDAGYAYCALALGDADLRPRLAELTVPLKMIVASDDPVISVDEARSTSDRVGRGCLSVIADASHLAVVEKPAAVVDALLR